jgi:hypothetical protein
VQNAEAARLEVLSKQVDNLLDVLQQNPVCTPFVAAVRHVSRNGVLLWTATTLPWTYVSQLDQLLDKLTFVCREAKAIGGDDAARNIIERIWPSGKVTLNGGDRSNGRNSRERTPHGSSPIPSAPREPIPVVSGTLASLLQRLGGERADQEKKAACKQQGCSAAPASAPQGPGQGPESRSSTRPGHAIQQERKSRRLPSSSHARQTGSKAEPDSSAAKAAVVPEQLDSAESAESLATAPQGADVPRPREQPRQQPVPARKAANADHPGRTDRALLRRLLAHHEGLGRTINYEPLSSTELRRDLGWSQAKVQRAMMNVFGPKPSSVYRTKCRKRTISTFLEAQAGGAKPRRVPTRAKPQKAAKAPRASAQRNSRRKSRRRVSV